jgi:hypothetical protein
LVSQLESIQTLITPAALDDEYKSYDYGFTDQDFLDAIDHAWGSHIPTSISSYILNRFNAANLQTTTTGIANPCTLEIPENTMAFGIPVKAYNLLGQEVALTTTQQILIVEDQFGNRKKMLNL